MSNVIKGKNKGREKLMRRVQERLSQKLVLSDQFNGVGKVGGVDQAFQEGHVYSGFVVTDKSSRELEKKCASTKIKFPYIPGLLAFREIPPILKVWQKVEARPQLLLVDGHGIAHPRKLGLASHVGLALDVPTVGVAKSVLVGEYEKPEAVGEASNLRFDGETLGKVLKSKKNCNPIFVSPGHRVSVETSLETVKKCLRNHKLPEPLFRAHQYANEIKNRSSPNSE